MSKCRASGRGLQSRGIRVADDAVFTVTTLGAGPGSLDVTLSGPTKVKDTLKAKVIKPDTYQFEYSPQRPGEYTVDITFGGEPIPRSPFLVSVARQKDSSMRVFGPGLYKAMAGWPATFIVKTHGEPGVLGCIIEGPSEARIDTVDIGEGVASVTYWPTVAGEYAVHVTCDNEDIPGSPYMLDVTENVPNLHPDKVNISYVHITTQCQCKVYCG